MPETIAERQLVAELERRAREAEALVRISSGVRYDRPLSEVLGSLAANIVEHTRAISVAATLLDPRDLSSIAYGEANVPPGYTDAMIRMRQQPGEVEQLRRAVAETRTWVLRDARQWMLARPAYAPMIEMIRGVSWQTVIGTAFTYRPEAIAVVYLCYEDGVDVDDAEVAFARAIAFQTAPAMDNAWLFSETQRQASELGALARADAAMHESLRLQDVLQAMADLAVDLLGADKSILGTADEEGRSIIRAVRGVSEAEVVALNAIYQKQPANRHMNTRPEIQLVEDVRTDPDLPQEVRDLNPAASFADIPIFVDGRAFAFFVIGYTTRHQFSDEDRRLFDQLATRAGLAIQNALSFEASMAQTTELDAKVGQLEALSRADAALHESLRLQDVFEVIVELALDLLSADKALFTTVDAEGRLVIRAHTGMTEDVVDGLRAIYRERSRDRYTGVEQQIEMVEDLQNDPRVEANVRELAPAVSYADIPMFVDGGLYGFFIVGYDTKRTFAESDLGLFDTLARRATLAIQNALLFEESTAQTAALDEKVGQMEALSRADASLHESLRLQDVFETMVDLATEFVGADRSLLIAWNDEGHLHAYAVRGVSEPELVALNEVYHTVGKDDLADGYEITVMPDVQSAPNMNPGIRKITPAKSTVDIPLFVDGELFGLFVISWTRPRTFTDEDMKLFETLGSRTSLAIQNAQLYEQSARQTRELDTRVRQLEAVRAIAANLTVDRAETIYNELAEQVVRATSALACTVQIISEEGPSPVRMVGIAGMPPGFPEALDEAYARGAPSQMVHEIKSREGGVLRDGRAAKMGDPRFAKARELVAEEPWDTLVSVPIVYRDEPLGMLLAGYPADWQENGEEIAFLKAIADQGAIAMANARLLESASTVAALEERQRLARELHDSVSQALYGIALGAKTARKRMGGEGDPLAAEAVDYVISLAEAGLTETRALIFELIPEALENEGLIVAIKRHAAAIQARYQFPVHPNLCDEPELPLKTKEAIYRIAQESLNNIAKHANAQNAYVTLAAVDGRLTLEVRDDGAGFDPSGDFPGHLGLQSMTERARRIGARYEIASSPGYGATVRLSVPLA